MTIPAHVKKAHEIDSKLTSKDFEDNRCVAILHKQGSFMFLAKAFAKIDSGWLMVFSDMHQPFAFPQKDVQYLEIFLNPVEEFDKRKVINLVKGILVNDELYKAKSGLSMAGGKILLVKDAYYQSAAKFKEPNRNAVHIFTGNKNTQNEPEILETNSIYVQMT